MGPYHTNPFGGVDLIHFDSLFGEAPITDYVRYVVQHFQDYLVSSDCPYQSFTELFGFIYFGVQRVIVPINIRVLLEEEFYGPQKERARPPTG